MVADSTSEISNEIQSLYNAAQHIRDSINENPLQSKLLSNHEGWLHICAALDAIEDICGVADSFLNGSKPPLWQGQLLHLYGILQALFVQQDACKSLATALGHPLFQGKWETDHPKLHRIRNLRNRSIGHPSDYNSGNAKPAGHISRPTISNDGMTIMITNKDGVVFENVSVPELIRIQSKELTALLKKLSIELMADDYKYKEKFKDSKMLSLFNCTSYFCTKIAEGIRNKNTEYVRIHLELMKSLSEKIREHASSRFLNIENCTVLVHELSDFDYATQRLLDFTTGEMSERDAAVFWHYLNDKRNTLSHLSSEIDDIFSHDLDGNRLPW